MNAGAGKGVENHNDHKSEALVFKGKFVFSWFSHRLWGESLIWRALSTGTVGAVPAELWVPSDPDHSGILPKNPKQPQGTGWGAIPVRNGLWRSQAQSEHQGQSSDLIQSSDLSCAKGGDTKTTPSVPWPETRDQSCQSCHPAQTQK